MRSRARSRLPSSAAANVQVSCQQGTHKFNMEMVNKGFYEVVGTLGAGGSITEMNSVYMGDNFGARRPRLLWHTAGRIAANA